ncbi:MAG: SpoIIE family protein phosphatase [Planctomycetes bacterium]|nr:SpoIIE family protein phosphatase [Planctomycetota bacterium]
MASGDKPDSPSVEQLEAELQAARRELERREQMWESQLNIAARVHRSLLPKSVSHPRIEVEVRYVPMEAVGGDYCQVLFPVDSQCYVTLCDVTGHGIGPALLATRVSGYVRQLVMQQLSPNSLIRSSSASHNSGTDRHTTT